MVTKEPRTTSKEIRGELQGQGTSVFNRTIRHCLSQSGLNGRRPRRTPLLKANHKKTRLEFAKMHIDKPQSFWKNDLWTEETKLDLFGKSHQLYVHRCKNEAYKEKNTVVKHGGGSVMFWGYFAASGTRCLESTISRLSQDWLKTNSRPFWSKICCPLSESLVSVAGHGSSNRIMTQNTQLKTPTNGRTKHWTILKWPSVSPDLNPIEHLWKELKHAVWRRHTSNLRQLEQFSHEEWAKIPVDRCRSLIESYRNCLIAVIASKGCATKYLIFRVPSFLSRPVSFVCFFKCFCWTTIQKQCLIFIS